MFLVVFVTLVISIIGLYAQVLSIQSTRLYNSQKGLMQTMLTWHNNAIGLLRPDVLNNDILNIGPGLECQITNATNTPFTNCKTASGGIVLSTSNMPPGSLLPNYTFYSVLFQPQAASPFAGIDYIVTYVHDTDATSPVNDPSGNLELPDSSGVAIGYSMASLMNQFAHNAPYNVTYGFVTAPGFLTVQPKSIGAPGGPHLVYTIPTLIPTNSLAVISVAN